jgi:hypothetical protein
VSVTRRGTRIRNGRKAYWNNALSSPGGSHPSRCRNFATSTQRFRVACLSHTMRAHRTAVFGSSTAGHDVFGKLCRLRFVQRNRRSTHGGRIEEDMPRAAPPTPKRLRIHDRHWPERTGEPQPSRQQSAPHPVEAHLYRALDLATSRPSVGSPARNRTRTSCNCSPFATSAIERTLAALRQVRSRTLPKILTIACRITKIRCLLRDLHSEAPALPLLKLPPEKLHHHDTCESQQSQKLTCYHPLKSLTFNAKHH